jgi:hypothetical protein
MNRHHDPLGYTEALELAEPRDGYGAGFIEYSIRTSFRDLCRVLGKSQARQVIAEIVNDEFEGKRQ